MSKHYTYRGYIDHLKCPQCGEHRFELHTNEEERISYILSCTTCEDLHFFEDVNEYEEFTNTLEMACRAPLKRIASSPARCRYPENGGGGHVEYCSEKLVDDRCSDHGPRRQQ